MSQNQYNKTWSKDASYKQDKKSGAWDKRDPPKKYGAAPASHGYAGNYNAYSGKSGGTLANGEKYVPPKAKKYPEPPIHKDPKDFNFGKGNGPGGSGGGNGGYDSDDDPF
ncbi:uncharacterized protein RAG0_10891 [Rhynchosporium agropyri]|uniref:Uncharacterized protein n=1 Tax=Rhynchosporium agropyri TaxID=914238 RepID=A0A1E1L1Q3_9HELO|nr:uncharacterized protein RAG0_10891 [Rhynchosporium agropyri]